MLIIGIDPGITGSICFFEDGKIIDVLEMPNMAEGKKNKKQVNGAQIYHEISLRIKNLKKDPFLSEQLYKVELIKDQYQLKLKSFDFEIIFGSPKRMKEKIKKLKVFCTFQRAQDSLTNYQKINLSYTNQVVATTY